MESLWCLVGFSALTSRILSEKFSPEILLGIPFLMNFLRFWWAVTDLNIAIEHLRGHVKGGNRVKIQTLYF